MKSLDPVTSTRTQDALWRSSEKQSGGSMVSVGGSPPKAVEIKSTSRLRVLHMIPATAPLRARPLVHNGPKTMLMHGEPRAIPQTSMNFSPGPCSAPAQQQSSKLATRWRPAGRCGVGSSRTFSPPEPAQRGANNAGNLSYQETHRASWLLHVGGVAGGLRTTGVFKTQQMGHRTRVEGQGSRDTSHRTDTRDWRQGTNKRGRKIRKTKIKE